jgi:chaperone required for assembly of F1-ATPase
MSIPLDPLERPKRFYKAAASAPVDGGYAVQLDGRTPKTPSGARLIVPTEALAILAAEEWAGQGEFILTETMPVTRLANTAIDRIGKAREAVAEEVARYAGSDLVCYLADGPGSLIEAEEGAWAPLRDWGAGLGVDLHPVAGIVHKPQPAASLERVHALALELDAFTLAGLAHAAGLFGSAVIALALQRGHLSGEAAFEASRVDEAFQEAQWGVDEEAAERTSNRRQEALMLERWFVALQELRSP